MESMYGLLNNFKVHYMIIIPYFITWLNKYIFKNLFKSTNLVLEVNCFLKKQGKKKKNIYIYIYIHTHTHTRFWLHTDTSDGMAFFIQFSHSVVSDSLRPHELQHARLPCPSSGVGDGQGGLACCSSWDHRVGHD